MGLQETSICRYVNIMILQSICILIIKKNIEYRTDINIKRQQNNKNNRRREQKKKRKFSVYIVFGKAYFE